MKKLIFAILLIGLVSCGRQTAKFDEPFIVKQIEFYDVTTCEYIGFDQEGGDVPLGSIYPKIYAPCGLYQIGDTIKLDR